jgi:hypothetical protein
MSYLEAPRKSNKSSILEAHKIILLVKVVVTRS